jgi:LysM repeat protein
MPELKKAELVEISSGDNPQPVGTPDLVQFNPTTLRVQISNRTAGGQQAGAQARQRPGTGEVTVSFDLVFDTADEGDDVLKRTSIVERYVRPKGNARGQEAAPRVQFTWGSFMVQGTMESANIDIDLFDADGTPLRAKVAVSIKGQDPRWTYQPAPQPSAASGGGSAQAVNAAGLPSGAPGSSGSNQAIDRVVQAMPGESVAQLAARFGLDPGAWRSLAGGLDNPLSLKLGQEVPLPSANAQGSASGAQAQGKDPALATANIGLVAAAGPASVGGTAAANSARRAPQQVGLALTVRGGLSGAIAQTRAQDHQAGADASLAAFGLAAAATGDSSQRPWGAGVPLRPRFGTGTIAARRDPTQPGWLAATPAAANTGSSTPATTVSAAKASGPKPGCGCGGKSA